MENGSKLLPDSISGALKSITRQIFGGFLCVLGIWLLFVLFSYNQYLDGFSTASTFGSQTLGGQFIGFIRYCIGFVPSAFMYLCLIRWGISWLFGVSENSAPEYNVLRFFVAICFGGAGFGLILPSVPLGGLVGSIVAMDINNIFGAFSSIIGILCLTIFLFLASVLLHIKWVHVIALSRVILQTLRWILSVFHLMPYSQRPKINTINNMVDDTYDDADEENTNSVIDAVERVQKKGGGQRTGSKKRVERTAIARNENKDVMVTDIAEYKLPDPAFLERSNFGKNIVTPELKQNAKAMEIHFAEFGVKGSVVGIRPGPIVTLYEFELESGTRMSKVKDTVEDMIREMATHNIRIAHIPGTTLIGVEMVNLNRQTVKYRSLIEDPMFINSKYKIPLALGVNIGGNPMYYDLAKMPHMLIAGRTGSGKSVFVQSIITSIVYHFTPDKCKLMIIDPKGVDFGFWDDIPHLITPIVKLDPVAAVNALKWAVREMDDRYKRMAFVNARDFTTYNEIMAQKRANGEVLTQQVAVGTDEETGEILFETKEIDMSPWAYIVIVIDEVADLMSLARKEVEACIQRIAQKARACGIHLVMATQRPDATTITGVIKANFPTRVSFQARSYIDSMTTLGDKGAEQLLACGDMLFSEGGLQPVRIHGAFISDTELTKIGNFLRTQGTPEYASGVTDGEIGDTDIASGGGTTGTKANNKDGDLYEQAKEIVLRDKKPTISYIQRRLSIGYNKAAGFIERMEQEGVVSSPDANNKRHIL
ncbi:MAG: DNA translocase FtsK [Alphaproteobacteria bacterium]|nr:DNA translocase FtsK [Alphaproteobacteria bacterium]